ncbi:hypothetical protein pEaSNUABM29_00030 [Erwinia phage pEa_SNUABM_29]|nr:hypothetical protein pEaSNUABM29_00030 [Erwinia phage pEa_SNUABM_29]
MKLLMPAPRRNNFAEVQEIHALRTTVKSVAQRLNVEVEECDYDKFVEFAFVAEAYRAALFHAMFADEQEAMTEYLERCCQVFRDALPEMVFVDMGLPDYVMRGLDGILESCKARMPQHPEKAIFYPPHQTLQ